MPSWVQGQQYTQQMYGGYGAYAGGYPNTTAGGSPMNYGAYYPPGSTYGGPSAYNRAHPAASSYTPTIGANYNQQPSSGASNGKPGASNVGNDSAFLTGMQNVSLANN